MTERARTGPGADPPEATTTDVDELRRQVTELRAELAAAQAAGHGGETVAPVTGGSPGGQRTGRWRVLVAGFLLVLAVLTVPLSVMATWAHGAIGDTDRYMSTVAPLAEDPAIKAAIADRISAEIFAALDIDAVTQQAVDALAAQDLPPRVSAGVAALAIPLANGARSFISSQVTRLVESDQFATAWMAANRVAHAQLVAVLSGEGSESISVSEGTVSLNVGPLVDQAKQQLVSAGFGLAARIPQVQTSFTLFTSPDIVRAQTAFALLDAAATWLPWVGIALLGGALYVSRNRRKTFIAAGLLVVALMLLLGTALNILRPIYLGAVPADVLPQDAAAVVYDTLVGYIRTSLRAVLVVGLAVSLGAWLSGPSAAAVAARQMVVNGLGAARRGAAGAGLRTGPVGTFAFRFRVALRAGVLVVGGLVYVLAEYPTAGWTLGLLGVVVVALALLEFLARPPLEADQEKREGSDWMATA